MQNVQFKILVPGYGRFWSRGELLMVCQRWLKSKRDVLLSSLFKENPVSAVNVLNRAPTQLTHTGVNVTTYLQQNSDLEDKCN